MRELLGRVTALDPEAGAAMRVITYFDELLERRAGLESVVRGAAFLAGCPARFIDDQRRLLIRIDPDGRHLDGRTPVDDHWPVQNADGPARLLLERPAGERPGGVLDAVILERAAATARTVLDRTRSRPGTGPDTDPASVEVLLDRRASERERRRAADRLGLADTARAIALPGHQVRIEPVPPVARTAEPSASQRAGVGPAVAVMALPDSWEAARTALRFTAEATPHDPGPRVVHADDLGTLTVLAAHIRPGDPPTPDMTALDAAASCAPWMLLTLDTVATSTSLRAAANALNLHHSTLRSRLAQAERLLKWDPVSPTGRLRLQLALIARRLHRNL
ncbi:helix-turn-helix domain-containing protein [Spirillospora sp. NPDC029432]|uniref:helix-turn-helix domain-containing protein n=1 Tax=Spirillospora sp. NPDC029432 TaxID=3154599 RepID=UPI003451BC96